MPILHVSGLWSLSREAIRTLAELVSVAHCRVEALVITGVSRTGSDYSHCCYLVHLLQRAFALAANRLILLPAGGDLLARTHFNRECHVPILRRPYRVDEPAMLDLEKCFLCAMDTDALRKDVEAWQLCAGQLMKACPDGKNGLLISNRVLENWNQDSLRIINTRLQELTCDPASSPGEGCIATPAGSLRLLRDSGAPSGFESALHMVLPMGGTDFSSSNLTGPLGRGGGVPSQFTLRLFWSELAKRSAAFSDLRRSN